METQIQHQICRTCGKRKELNGSNFHQQSTYKLGFNNRCKVCSSKYYRERYYKDIKKTRKRERERKQNRSEERMIQVRKWARAHKTPSGIYRSYRKRTKKVLFDLTKEQFLNLIDKPCVYCGENARGVDRVDNNDGYILSNSVSCCGRCNKMKMDMTVEQFIQKCKDIIRNHIAPLI